MVTRNDRAGRVSDATFELICFFIRSNLLQYSHLYRGVYPFVFPEKKPDFSEVPWQEDVDRRLTWGIMHAIKLGVLNQGDAVICVQGWRGGMGHTNTLRVVEASMDLGLTGE